MAALAADLGVGPTSEVSGDGDADSRQKPHEGPAPRSRNLSAEEIRPMTADKVYLTLFWAAAMGFWSMPLWGHWAERTYEKGRDHAYMWFWLRVFGIPQTKENCIRFVKGTSLVGMVLLTLMTGAVVLLGK